MGSKFKVQSSKFKVMQSRNRVLSAQWRAYAWYFAFRLSRALLHSLRSAVIGPHPSPPPLRQGREILYTVTEFSYSLPCRSGGGLGWGPMTAERRVFSHILSSTARTSPKTGFYISFSCWWWQTLFLWKSWPERLKFVSPRRCPGFWREHRRTLTNSSPSG